MEGEVSTASVKMPPLDLDPQNAVHERGVLDLVERQPGEEGTVLRARVTRVHVREGEHRGLPVEPSSAVAALALILGLNVQACLGHLLRMRLAPLG